VFLGLLARIREVAVLQRWAEAHWDELRAEYIRKKLNFPGCQIALRVDRDIIGEDGAVRLQDTRYFLTSVDPGQIRADELLAHVASCLTSQFSCYSGSNAGVRGGGRLSSSGIFPPCFHPRFFPPHIFP
jgi:hypothetical protein